MYELDQFKQQFGEEPPLRSLPFAAIGTHKTF